MALHTIEWVTNVYGAQRQIRTYPEGDSETFKKGSPVIYDDSEDGVVAIADTSGVPDAQTMIGIALEDASGTSDEDLDVLIVQPGDVFSGMLASDEDTAVAPARDNVIGELFGIIKVTTSYTAGTDRNSQTAAGTEWAVDTGNTNWVRVIDYDYRDLQRVGGTAASVGSLQAADRVLFQFLGSIIDSAGHQA